MSFDRTDAADLLALKTEVTTDPLTLGYDPDGPTQDLLDLLNGVPTKDYTVSKPAISAAAIRAAVTFDAYDTLLADKQEWIRWITGSNGVNEESLVVTQDLRDRLTGVLGGSLTGDSIWSAAQDDVMEPIMIDLIDVPGSRAEVLFGYGTLISRDDWIAARDS